MKKLLLNTLIGLALLTCQTSFAQKTKAKFSPIKVETPARPANLLLRTDVCSHSSLFHRMFPNGR